MTRQPLPPAAGDRDRLASRRSPVVRALLLAAAVAPLAACGGEEPPPAPPRSIERASPAPAADPVAATPAGGYGNGRIALGPVVWALALDPDTGGPAQPVGAIPADAPRFWAAIPVLRAEPGVRLTAEWSYNDTPMPALAADAVIPEGAVGWVVFDLALPAGERWPVGDYAVAVAVAGQPALAAAVPAVAADS